MRLPFVPPVAPMLAKAVSSLPAGDDLVYEPKWDGFRTIVFFDGDELELSSRNERPLTRYFPELDAPFRTGLGARCVLDGEIVIASGSGLDFGALLQRVHPAASRVARLSVETPASFVAFDLLALADEDLRDRPFKERRALLEELLAEVGAPIHLTPQTADIAIGAEWLERFEGAGLDGVVAKRVGLGYRENERVMFKVKHERVADCVVAGFRWHTSGPIVGSLLLGLYDEAGVLQHVGVTSSFTAARRAELVGEIEPYREGADLAHPWLAGATSPSRRPGQKSRWSGGKDTSFEPLRAELVCEVAYDHLEGDRCRHATTFRRFRPDRDPASCTYDQLESALPFELADVLGASPGGASAAPA